MVHADTSPALSLVSAWFVFSVGLMDAIVYVSDTGATVRHKSDALLTGLGGVFGQAKSTEEDA